MRPGADVYLGREAIDRLADAALDLRGTAGVEVLIDHNAGGLTRFANSQIHQNVWTEDCQVRVRVATDDGRVGVAESHTHDPAVVASTAHDALALARVAPPDPDFPGLAPPADSARVPFDEATAAASPGLRAAAVRALLDELEQPFEAAGAFQTRLSEVAVLNSEGQRAYSPQSSTHLTAVVMGPSSSGWAEAGGRSIAEVDPAAVGRRAVAKARAGANPVDIDAGAWRVVLEPPAAGALIEFLAFLGFGAKGLLEERSLAVGRIGKPIVDPRVTLVDDAYAPGTVGLPFDFEGTPKERVDLIRDGVLAGVVHDRHTAKKMGAVSTGHALPAPNPWGPFPINPVLVPGDGGSIDDLVAGTERGLLVTRFHYTNVVHPVEASVTGMTRDGTFLIIDGKIASAVRNLRFTQPILEALAEVEAISTETGYASELFEGGGQCPALRLPAFSFTGTTTFG